MTIMSPVEIQNLTGYGDDGPFNNSHNLSNPDGRTFGTDLTQPFVLTLAITFVLSTLGNICLALLLLKFIKLKSGRSFRPVYYLMLHTCAADMAFALFSILPQLVDIRLQPNYGVIGCKLIRYLQLLPMYASSYFEVAISIDRFIAICDPLKYLQYQHRRLRIIVFFAWVISFVFCAPQVFIFRVRPLKDGRLMCAASYSHTFYQHVYIVWFSLAAWLIPSVIIGCNYIMVIRAIWQSYQNSSGAYQSPKDSRAVTPRVQLSPRLSPGAQNSPRASTAYASPSISFMSTREGDNQKILTEPMVTPNGNTNYLGGNLRRIQTTVKSDVTRGIRRHSAETPERRYQSASTLFPPSPANNVSFRLNAQKSCPYIVTRRKIQTVKLTLTIIVCNFVLWSPFCITSLLTTFQPGLIDSVTATVILLTGNLNSCVNPWIYFAFHWSQIRQLCCGTARKDFPPEDSATTAAMRRGASISLNRRSSKHRRTSAMDRISNDFEA